MQRVLVIISSHHIQPSMDADIVGIAGAPVQPVNILRDQMGCARIALARQPVMHSIRRNVAIGGKAPIIPKEELPRAGFIHMAGGHFLRRVVFGPDGPVAILAAKGGNATVGADPRACNVECGHVRFTFLKQSYVLLLRDLEFRKNQMPSKATDVAL